MNLKINLNSNDRSNQLQDFFGLIKGICNLIRKTSWYEGKLGKDAFRFLSLLSLHLPSLNQWPGWLQVSTLILCVYLYAWSKPIFRSNGWIRPLKILTGALITPLSWSDSDMKLILICVGLSIGNPNFGTHPPFPIGVI